MEARIKQEADEELAIAQGFQISDYEIADAQKKTDNTAERLKQLREERTAALNRKKMLDELHERQLANEAEIARLEEELQRLRGGTSPTTDGTRPNQANSSEPPAKPGI